MIFSQIKQLADLSREKGQNFLYTQGGGGNISFKNKEFMWIKPSGGRLKDMTDKPESWVKLDLKKLAESWETVKRNKTCGFSMQKIIENTSRNLAGSIVKQNGISVKPPSIETFMHLLSGKFVLHHHFLPAIFVSTTDISNELLSNIAKHSDFQIVKTAYHTPGIPLASAMDTLISRYGKENVLYLLKNHGLIVSADSIRKIREISDKFTSIFTEITGLEVKSDVNFQVTEVQNGIYEFSADYLKPEYISKPLTTDYYLCFGTKFETAVSKNDLNFDETSKKLVFTEGKAYFKADNRTENDFAEVLACQIQLGLWAKKIGCNLQYLTESEVKKFRMFAIGKYAEKI